MNRNILPKRRALLKAKAKIMIQKDLMHLNKVKFLLPLLHTKLGLMKKYIKALPKGDRYICRKFPALLTDKIKEVVFTSPGIRKLMKDGNFDKQMKVTLKGA